MKPPLNKNVQANAIVKSGNDMRVRTVDWWVGDSEVEAEHDNQLLDNEGLGA